ncbi:MAG: DnaA N-terminal domain-containing protein, partial [Ilumatobacter fluminis]
MSDQDEVWTAVAQILRSQLTESVWYSTFAEVVPQLDDDHQQLVIQVPSTLARERILTRYQPLITDAMADLGFSDRRFDVIIGGAERPEHTGEVPVINTLIPTAEPVAETESPQVSGVAT